MLGLYKAPNPKPQTPKPEALDTINPVSSIKNEPRDPHPQIIYYKRYKSSQTLRTEALPEPKPVNWAKHPRDRNYEPP